MSKTINIHSNFFSFLTDAAPIQDVGISYIQALDSILIICRLYTLETKSRAS